MPDLGAGAGAGTSGGGGSGAGAAPSGTGGASSGNAGKAGTTSTAGAGGGSSGEAGSDAGGSDPGGFGGGGGTDAIGGAGGAVVGGQGGGAGVSSAGSAGAATGGGSGKAGSSSGKGGNGMGGTAGVAGSGSSGVGGAAGPGGAAGASGAAGAGGVSTAGSGGVAGAGPAGSGGLGGTGGVGGSSAAGSGGASGAGTAGTAGAGGGSSCVPPATPTGVDPCGPGSYCDSLSLLCTSCTDLSNVAFRTPVAFSPGGTVGGEVQTPRLVPVGTETALLFSAKPSTASMEQQIHAITFPAGVASAPALVPSVTNGFQYDVAPLVIPAGMTGADLKAASNGTGNLADPASSYVIVDSRRGYTDASGANFLSSNARHAHVAQIALTGATTAWGSLDLINTGAQDFGVAFAAAAPSGAQRFFWTDMRTVGGSMVTSMFTVLVTEQPSAGKATAVQLGGCQSPDVPFDYNAWITPEGSRLFITGRCVGSRARIYMTTPNLADGTLPPFKPVSIETYDPNGGDAGASLSPDKCEMWFTRKGVIHSARRK